MPTLKFETDKMFTDITDDIQTMMTKAREYYCVQNNLPLDKAKTKPKTAQPASSAAAVPGPSATKVPKKTVTLDYSDSDSEDNESVDWWSRPSTRRAPAQPARVAQLSPPLPARCQAAERNIWRGPSIGLSRD